MRKLLNYRLILLSIVFWSISVSSYAQFDDKIRNHTIISVDCAGCPWARSAETRNAVRSFIEEKGIYREEDMCSLVGFRAHSRDMETYAIDKYSYIKKCDGNCLWYNWASALAGVSNDGMEGYSLVSVAKPYSLKALKTSGNYTNRTFLVMVTDRRYNGGDFYAEVIEFLRSVYGQYIPVARVRAMDNLFKVCYDVEKEYYIKYLETRMLGINRYLEFYEFIPLQETFSLPSVWDYRNVIKAKRCKGHKFEVALDILPRNNTRYAVKKVELKLSNGRNANTLEGTIDTVRYNAVIENGKNRPRALNMKVWVNLIDGCYNATILSPSSAAPDYLGRNGLNLSIPIQYEEPAKIVFFIPMPDFLWWFFPEDQYKAAIAMNAIIAMLLFVILLIYIKVRQYYKLTSTDISF